MSDTKNLDDAHYRQANGADAPILPPLPPEELLCGDEAIGDDIWGHTAEQMTAYARAALAQAAPASPASAPALTECRHCGFFVALNQPPASAPEDEIWKEVPGYPNYMVSTSGLVKSQKCILKPRINRHGYEIVSIFNWPKRRDVCVHRLVMEAFSVRSDEEGRIIDHIDRDPANNKLSNLRWATVSQNGFNQKKRKNCTSNYKGVFLDKSSSKWYAQIRAPGHAKSHIGVFDSEIAAARAYNDAAIRLHGEFASINQLDPVAAPLPPVVARKDGSHD